MEEKRISSLAFPANSDASKKRQGASNVETSPVKDIKQVSTKSAKASKKGPVKQLLLGVFHDTVLPALKDMFFDTISDGLSTALYGETYGGSRRAKDRKKLFDYGKISTIGYSSVRDRLRDRKESSAVMEDLIFESREDAVLVLDGIIDIMETYELVSVADVYMLSGFGTTPTDNKYGWDSPSDIAKMKIARHGRDWCLKLPKPYPID